MPEMVHFFLTLTVNCRHFTTITFSFDCKSMPMATGNLKKPDRPIK